VPSSLMTSAEHLMELGYSDLTQLEEVTHNIGKQEVIVLCFIVNSILQCVFISQL
jgi:hypothetical protein